MTPLRPVESSEIYLLGRERRDLEDKHRRLQGMGGKESKRERKNTDQRLRAITTKELKLRNEAETPDIPLEEAQPGDVVKTLDGYKVIKGDLDGWLYLRSTFLVRHTEIIKDIRANSYREAIERIFDTEAQPDNYPELEEVYMSDPEFAPVIDPKKAQKGKVLKAFPGGIEIVKYDPNFWTDFSVRCPRRKNPIPEDTYSEALRTVRAIQEYGDGFMPWDLKDEFKK